MTRAPVTAAGTGSARTSILVGASPDNRVMRRGDVITPTSPTTTIPATPSCHAGAAPGAAQATTAAPVPTASACITSADAAAAQPSTPARRARTANPATLQTFPGR